MTVTIVDLGYGNLGSIRIAFERLGATVEQSADPERLQLAERLVLPGVGSASYAMQRIRERGLEQTLRAFPRPFLGICLGMQLLFDWSEEAGTPCLGIIKGKVRKLETDTDRPVPHMGWSKLRIDGSGHGLRSGDYVYFAHSYMCEAGPHSFAYADDGGPIPAALARDNVLGCQFHPERSSKAGARFLAAFLAS